MNTYHKSRSGQLRQGWRSLRIYGAAIAAVGTISFSLAATAQPAAAASGKGDLTAAQVTTLQNALTAAAAPSKYVQAGPAVDAKSLKGKTLFLLVDGSENQFEQSFISGITAACKALGINFTMGNGNSVTSQDDQLLENAVTAKVSVVMLSAQAPSTLSAGLAAVKAAGIPIVETFAGDPHLPTAAEKALGVSADGTYCYSCTGLISAEYAILQDGGKMDSMVQQYPGSPSSDSVVVGWVKGVKEFCPKTCSISYDNVTIGASTVQEIQSGTQVAAQNPAINTIFPVYDYQMGYMLPELAAAKASSRISLLSENADLAQMQEMESGTSVKVDVGNPVAWDGWASVDQAVRVMLKKPPLADEKVPVRLFDVANVSQLNLSANPATWYGGANYEADYEKLWGLG